MKLYELIEMPKERCNNPKCPHHGNIKVRGNFFKGKVIKKSDPRTVTVEWIRYYWLPKYERYEKRTTTMVAHNPSCIDAKVGDKVKVAECRPISKTKSFVVIEKTELSEE